MYSNGHPTYGRAEAGRPARTYSSYVRIRFVAMKTCQRRWTIGRSGERGSGLSVLAAWHDDDDEISMKDHRLNLVLETRQENYNNNYIKKKYWQKKEHRSRHGWVRWVIHWELNKKLHFHLFSPKKTLHQTYNLLVPYICIHHTLLWNSSDSSQKCPQGVIVV